MLVHGHVGAGWKTCDWWCSRLLLLKGGRFVVGQNLSVFHVADLVGSSIGWDVA